MSKPFKIVLTGVESSGKTVLAETLAQHYGVKLVEEYAREYLLQKKTNYVQADLTEIAKGQLKLMGSASGKIIICDTDLQVIKIWSLIKYNSVDKNILEAYEKDYASLYILCDPDFPWEFDELRENEFDRDKVHVRYLEELNANKLNYIIASGSLEERKKYCINCINDRFSTTFD